MDCSIKTYAKFTRLAAMCHSLLMNCEFPVQTMFEDDFYDESDYLADIIHKSTTKYVININESAFVFNQSALMDLLKHIDDNDYGVCNILAGEPTVDNTGEIIIDAASQSTMQNVMFNVFNIDIVKGHTPVKLATRHSMFVSWVYTDIKSLYLESEITADGTATIVSNHEGRPFLKIMHNHVEYYNDPTIYKNINTQHFRYSSMLIYDIGFPIPCFNIPEYTKRNYLNQFESLNVKLKYILQFLDELVTTDGWMNLSKSRNDGMRQIINNCNIVVCGGIDVMIPKGLVEFTYHKCIQTDGFVYCYTRFMERSDWLQMSDEQMLQWPSAGSGVGGWLAMHMDHWVRLGGWNEDMYGWGFEDQEFHIRLKEYDITKVFTNSFPLVHINHPKRHSDQVKTQRRNIGIVSGSKNWLRD